MTETMLWPINGQWLTIFLAKKRETVEVETAAAFLSALSAFHEALTLQQLWTGENPTKDSVAQVYMRRQKQVFGVEHRSQIPIRADHWMLFLEHPFESLEHLHWQLMAAVCYLAMLRSVAACSLTWHSDPLRSDIILPRTGSGEDWMTLIVRRDKMLKRGQVRQHYLLDGSAPGRVLLGKILRQYLRRTQLPDNSQLLAVPTQSDWRRCTNADITRMAQEVTRYAAADAAGISSHSFRHGGGSWYSDMGATEEQIKDAGGWRSAAVHGYTGTSKMRQLRTQRRFLSDLE